MKEMTEASGKTIEEAIEIALMELDAARDEVDFIIINPAGYTHSSIALRDALKGTAIPFIETHLSNVHARETFRRHSYFSDIAVGVIAGFGAHSYRLALDAVLTRLGSAA